MYNNKGPVVTSEVWGPYSVRHDTGGVGSCSVRHDMGGVRAMFCSS